MEGYFVEEDYKPVPPYSTLIRDPIPGYNPNMPIHFVLLHLPEHAPHEMGPERDRFVHGWLNPHNVNKILSAFKSPDNLRPQGYGWDNRGWRSRAQFDARVAASLKKYNVCVLSRKLTYEEAIRLQRRLSNEYCGFRTSAVVFPFKCIASLAPTCLTDSSHGRMTITTTYTTCVDCRCLYIAELSIPTHGTTAYSCAACGNDFCLLCAYTRFMDRTPSDCQVLSGYLAGTQISFPPQDAALNALEADPFGPIRDQVRSHSASGPDNLTPDQRRQFEQYGIVAFRDARGEVGLMIDGSRHAGVQPHNIPGFHETMQAVHASQSTPAPPQPSGNSSNTSDGGSVGAPPTLDDLLRASSGRPPAGLDDLFRMLTHSNAKPKTKPSVIAALPRSTFDVNVHKETDCAMCQGKFSAGDSIITLPCKHYFHGDGPISSECSDCSLITNFLKESNECPICRYQLESDDGPEKQRNTWKCPGCEVDVTGMTCPTCTPVIRRNASAAYYHEYFNDVEKLFIEITEFRLRQQAKLAEEAQMASSSAGDEEDPETSFKAMKIKQLTTTIDELKLDRRGLSEKDELVELLVEHSKKANTKPKVMVDNSVSSREIALMHSKINDVLSSPGYMFLASCGWDFSPVKEILEINLSGKFDKKPMFMIVDENSRVVLQLFLKRLERLHAEKFPQDKQYTISRTGDEQWTCSLCSYSNSFNFSPGESRPHQATGLSNTSKKCENCPASLSSALLLISEDIKPVYKEFCDLLSRCLQLTLRVNEGTISETEKYDLRAALKKDISAYLEGARFGYHLESKNFRVKRHLRSLFSRILKYERSFPFIVEGYLDMNSVAAYANFIHQARELVECNPAFKSVFDFQKPNAESVQQGDSFENFSEQRFKISSNSFIFQLIEETKDFIMIIARSIAFGTTEDQWEVFEKYFDRLLMLNVPIKAAIIAMKSGLRDLDTLVQNMDQPTKFLTEVFLRKVKHFEIERSFIELDDILDVQSPRGNISAGNVDDSISMLSLADQGGGRALLRRQNSIGTDIRSALTDLKLNLPDLEIFSQIIKRLYKIAANINGNPSKLEFRRLLKDSKNYQLYVAPYSEVQSVIQFMGFIESPKDPTRLYLRNLKLDEILRACHVLKELASASNIKLD